MAIVCEFEVSFLLKTSNQVRIEVWQWENTFWISESWKQRLFSHVSFGNNDGYIFDILFCKPKREHLWTLENYFFLFHSKVFVLEMFKF